MSEVTAPEGFRHHVAMQVRWGDMDALGHVNNAVFLTYLEQARIRYMEEQQLWDGSGGGQGVIMARVELDYRQPVLSDDELHVFSRCVRLGNRSFVVAQQIDRVRDGQQAVAAQALTTAVAYDYRSGQSTPVPEEWRQRIRAYEQVPPLE